MDSFPSTIARVSSIDPAITTLDAAASATPTSSVFFVAPAAATGIISRSIFAPSAGTSFRFYVSRVLQTSLVQDLRPHLPTYL